VVNDGSTDKTARIIEDYRHVLESDITRFIYISQENEGVGAACNNALKKVTGEFLTLLDGNRQIMMRSDIKLPQPFASWSNSL
jgi:glycosyltransferase involved in cell wall biosynthesis